MQVIHLNRLNLFQMKINCIFFILAFTNNLLTVQGQVKIFPVTDKAAAMGTRLGVWGGPNGFGDTAEEERQRIETMGFVFHPAWTIGKMT